MKRKGQTEIMGLIVIVVLFMVILMVYVSFSLKPKEEKTLKQQIQADYMLDAILKYTPECGDVVKSMRDIIKECDFESNQEVCGRPCMDLLKEESKNIVELNKETKKYGYDLYIKKTKNNAEKRIEISKCSSDVKMADNQPIFGGASVNLAICIY